MSGREYDAILAQARGRRLTHESPCYNLLTLILTSSLFLSIDHSLQYCLIFQTKHVKHMLLANFGVGCSGKWTGDEYFWRLLNSWFSGIGIFS